MEAAENSEYLIRQPTGARVEAGSSQGWAADNAIRDKNLRAAKAEGEALLRERNRNPADRLAMKAMTWSLGGFKNVGVVNVTIENTNDFAVKDVGIRCYFSGKERNRSYRPAITPFFDSIPAKTKKGVQRDKRRPDRQSVS